MAIARINVALTERSTNNLAWLQEHTGMNKTDTINRAVQLLHYWIASEEEGAEWVQRIGDQQRTVSILH